MISCDAIQLYHILLANVKHFIKAVERRISICQNDKQIIRNRNRMKQIVSFEGLTYGSIMPTDVDGLIEFNRLGAYALFELKHRGAPLPIGQELALTEIVNDLQKAGKWAILFLCEHDVDDCEKDIIAAESKVKRVYWNRKWLNLSEKNQKTLKELMGKYFCWVERRGKLNNAEAKR